MEPHVSAIGGEAVNERGSQANNGILHNALYDAASTASNARMWDASCVTSFLYPQHEAVSSAADSWASPRTIRVSLQGVEQQLRAMLRKFLMYHPTSREPHLFHGCTK